MSDYSSRPHSNRALLALLLAGGGYVAYKLGLFNNVAATLSTVVDDVASNGAMIVPSSTANGDIAPTPAATASDPAPGAPSNAPRNIRNNNPGNIVYNILNQWRGQTGSDGTFSKFDTDVDGMRAAFILLRRYIGLYGLNTVGKIATRWAPAPANNPVAYAAGVALYSGVPVNAIVNPADSATLTAILRGITGVEAGGASWAAYYSPADFAQAFASSY